MKKMAWAVLALLPLVACGSDPESDEEMFSARLDGAQVLPAPPASLTGEAGFTSDGQAIAFSADLRGLSLTQQPNRFLRLRVHSGARGSNGPPLATISKPENEIPAGDRYLWQGQLGAAQLDTAASVQDVVNAMRSGGAYVQVTHWQILNLGENAVAIGRGQIESGN